MTDILFVSQALAMLNLAVAILVAWGVLRFLDRLGGQKFGNAWERLNSGGHVGLGLYLGLRFVGVAFLVGSAIF
ncbi:hypothetical protein [Oceanibaculum nanhaiense]|uniref:hypothetical protein n=1 Tax=Oceanibaculum nanhaiense TaxID=1909734 RepID=UPI003D2A2B0B